MFGWLDGRRCAVFASALVMLTASADAVRAQSWQLDDEKGVGGSVNDEQTATKLEQKGKEAAIRIVIETDRHAAVRAAGDTPRDRQKTPGLVVAQATGPDGGIIRPAPPTAADLLAGAAGASAVDAAFAADAPRPKARPVIQQAQFSPNTVAEPKGILPSRAADQPTTTEGPSGAAEAPAFLPSPRKPPAPAMIEQAMVEPAVLTPNVAGSPEASALPVAHPTGSALVQQVYTEYDYRLELTPGKGRELRIGQPLADIFVGDEDVVRVQVISPTKIIAFGNALGQTNVYGFDERGDTILAFDVNVVPDALAAQRALESVSPVTGAKVTQRSGTLVTDGGVVDIAEALEIDKATEGLSRTQGPTVNNTTIAGSQQVNIRVRFAEVSRNDVFNLGINWEALVDSSDFLFGLASGPGPVGEIDAFGSIFGNAEFGDVSIDAFIDALQREGIINLLAEPNLTAVNGETASFLAGGEIPIPVPGGGGDNVTFDYKEFGVSLDFIPTLLPGERINLRVRPEVSSISTTGGVVVDGFALPAFNKRYADTSIELASGQTFAVAGLFQRDLTTDTDKFPVLGDVPVLGQLFRSQRFRRYETELVILITPYLVKPISNPNIPVPNDRLDNSVGPLVKKTRKPAGFIVK